MPSRRSRVRFGNIVVCEDVREEKRRKNTLVGVFSGNISVEDMPAKVQLAIYIEVLNLSAGDNIELSVKIGDAKFGIKSSIDEDAESANLIMPRGIFPFERDGEIIIKASINDGRTKTILTKKVAKGNVGP